MIKFWLEYLKAHKQKTIDDVPPRWREAVRKELELEEQKKG